MTNQKISSLEAMRGIAAIWVLLHHGAQSVSHFVGSLGDVPLLANGYLGVDFFFVLSGFIIAMTSHRLADTGQGFREYIRARLVRIYVPYLPVGIAILALYLLLPSLSEGNRSPGIITSLTLLPSGAPPALSVAWTLVHELIFYAFFGIWFFSRRVFWALVVAWIFSIVAVYAVDISLERLAGYFLSPLNLCFVMGLGVFEFTRRVRIPAQLSVVATIAGLGLVLWQSSNSSPDRLPVALGFGLLVLASVSPTAQRIHITPWLVTLGAASYAIYLVHNPVLSLAVRALTLFWPVMMPAWGALATISAVSVFAGISYWWFYERRALAAVRGFSANSTLNQA